MKKNYRILAFMAAAVMTLAGCQKEMTPAVPEEKGYDLTVLMEADQQDLTKTEMNRMGRQVYWTKDEKAVLYLDGVRHSGRKGGITTSTDKSGSSLSITLKNVTGKPKFMEGFVGAEENDAANITTEGTTTAFGIILPEIQTMSSKSFDKLSDVLVIDTKDISTHDVTTPISGIRYHRLNAICKLKLTGMKSEWVTEKIKSIKFETAGTPIAGTFTYDYTTDQFVDLNNNQTSNSVVFTKNPSNSIEMQFNNDTTMARENSLGWMVAGAQIIPAQETITITLTTDKHVITKQQKIAAQIELKSAQLNIITINMSGATEEFASSYHLVTELNDIVEGGEYYFLTSKGNVLAGTCNKNQFQSTETPVIIENDYSVKKIPTDAKSITLVKDPNVDGAYKFKLTGTENYLSAKDCSQKSAQIVDETNAISWKFEKIEGEPMDTTPVGAMFGGCTIKGTKTDSKNNTNGFYSRDGNVFRPSMYGADLSTTPGEGNELPRLVRKVIVQ